MTSYRDLLEIPPIAWTSWEQRFSESPGPLRTIEVNQITFTPERLPDSLSAVRPRDYGRSDCLNCGVPFAKHHQKSIYCPKAGCQRAARRADLPSGPCPKRDGEPHHMRSNGHSSGEHRVKCGACGRSWKARAARIA